MMQRAPLKLSPDGYIRLSFSTFSSLPFVHLFTGCDPDLQDELQEQTILAESAGFSECVSTTTPSISLGWTWYRHGESNCLLLAPEPVRSNVMIVDMHGYDVGQATTSDLISHWLQYCDWQTMVRLALQSGFSANPLNMRLN
ncbi:DUF4902 domain-containing protein [Massilia sp. W12]|uniref:DUF4902 domain-containing protein n=1 Tax=Massilia sp. W12 TaxID=3126507 RepID=UPI0030D5E716